MRESGMELKGIHHLTAVSAEIRQNRRFYTRVMGMRLVKRSVNQDDVSAYHLFYADAVGTPGTDLTFFDWNVPRERRGTHSIVRTGLRVRGAETLDWWAARLAELDIATVGPRERDGRLTLDLEDPEGQRLALIDDGGAGDPPVIWEESAVPPPHQIRGLGPIVMSVPSLAPTDAVLREVLDMRPARGYQEDPGGHTVQVYEMGFGGGPHAELHVLEEPGAPPVRPGAGGVHHVAFRVADDEYEGWCDRLESMGVRNSGPVDRYYFRSLYFREPNGILFELATEGPGFGVDEAADRLGEKLALPPFLEPQRESILAKLKPIDG
jgi:glyoxalase family protein